MSKSWPADYQRLTGQEALQWREVIDKSKACVHRLKLTWQWYRIHSGLSLRDTIILIKLSGCWNVVDNQSSPFCFLLMCIKYKFRSIQYCVWFPLNNLPDKQIDMKQTVKNIWSFMTFFRLNWLLTYPKGDCKVSVVYLTYKFIGNKGLSWLAYQSMEI